MAEVSHSEGWGDWQVNHGYYGRVTDTSRLAWVIQSIRPNTEEAARELARRTDEITAFVRKHLGDRLPKQVANIEGSNVNSLTKVFLHQVAGPQNRVRLKAERTAEGWQISEYDFNSWSETLR